MVLAIALAVAGAARASEETYAVIHAIKFTCQPERPFGPTTVEAVADGNGAERVLTLLRVTSKDFDISVPKEALADLRVPMLDTLRVSTEAGYDKTPWLYVTFQLGNPQPGKMWDYPRAYLKVKEGKFVGRALRRTAPGKVTFEDLPMPPHSKLPADPGATTKPVTDEKAINALIAQLGDKDVKTRESATEKLIAIGDTARPMLEAALKKSPEPEVLSRLEKIMSNFKAGGADVAAARKWVELLMGGKVDEVTGISETPFSWEGREVLDTPDALKAKLHGVAKKKGPRDVKPDSAEALTGELAKEALARHSLADKAGLVVVFVRLKGDKVCVLVRPGDKPKVVGFSD